MSASGASAWAGRPVLVTGATGFVGTHLCRALAERGASLHVLARASADLGPLGGLDAAVHAGDLLDAASVERAVAAVAADGGSRAAVVHGGALISYKDEDRELSREVNVEGTRRVLTSCARHRVGRVVHVSSVVAVGFAPDARSELDEDAAFNAGALDCAYVDTKRAAEELALRAAAGLDVVAVCPGAIFGPAPKPSNTTRFLLQVARGGLGPFAPPGSLSVVGVEDVVSGILLAIERGARGKRYLLTNENYTHLELFGLAARALGRSAPRLVVPRPLWSAAVAGVSLAHRVRPFSLATPMALRLLGVHSRFDGSRARRELGWSPRPFPEVLAGTLAWMRSSGLLPAR